MLFNIFICWWFIVYPLLNVLFTETTVLNDFHHDTHLCSKKRSGTNPHPAVEGIEIGCVVCIVVVKHRTKPDNRQNERKEQKPSM